MKKILFVAAIAAMTFTSCKKDDDSNTDCFDCTASGVTSEICHTDGEDFYTVKIAGHSTNVDIQDGTNWEDIKAGLEATCDQ